MMTREHYLEHGPDLVLLDMDRLSASIFSEATYDYSKQVSRIADRIAPRVAPALSLSDLPLRWSEKDRQQYFADMSDMGADLSRVSRMALAHEMMEADTYWIYALDACDPILSSGIKRLQARQNPQDTAEDIKALTKLRELLEQGFEAETTTGRFAIQQAFATALAAGASWSRDDFEVLASHFVAHARIGNVHHRRFNLAAEHLPAELDELAREVRDCSMEPTVLKHEKRLSHLDFTELLEMASSLLRHFSDILANDQQTTKAAAYSRVSSELSRLLSDERLPLESRLLDLERALLAAMTIWPLSSTMRMATLSHFIAFQNMQKARGAALGVLNLTR